MKTDCSSPSEKSLGESVLPQDITDIPKEWKLALNIADEAHLPYLLPVRWQSTADKHQRIAFDPENNKIYNLEKEKFVKQMSNPVQFIKLTKGQVDMPGSSTPAAVRYDRYNGALNKHILVNTIGKELVPCIGHGDFVQVESLASDHLQAKDEILRRQRALVQKINDDSEFAEFLLNQQGMDKFFTKIDGVYYGTLFFYELYFNDIDNIWLICDACNLHKSNQDTLAWFQSQWLYGKEFLDYLAKNEISDKNILIKVGNKKGLAQVAIEWFWERHSNYITTLDRFFREIKLPIDILNQRIDHIIGVGKMKRAERLQASLDFRLALIEEILMAKGIDMPRAQSESLHSSSDDERYVSLTDELGNKIPLTKNEYQDTANEFAETFKELISSTFKDKLQEKIKNKSSELPQTNIPAEITSKKRKSEEKVDEYPGQLKKSK